MEVIPNDVADDRSDAVRPVLVVAAMSDYYTLFSEAIRDVTPEQKEWLEKRHAELQETEDPNTGGNSADFHLEVRGNVAYITSDESGNVEHVEAFMREFLRRFKINEPFALTWADTCSKLETGAFGGGAFIVRRGQRTRWMSTSAWAAR